MKLKEKILTSLMANAQGNLMRHKANVEVYLENPAGIGEHSDVMESIELELDKMSNYEERIEILKKHFDAKQF